MRRLNPAVGVPRWSAGRERHCLSVIHELRSASYGKACIPIETGCEFQCLVRHSPMTTSSNVMPPDHAVDGRPASRRPASGRPASRRPASRRPASRRGGHPGSNRYNEPLRKRPDPLDSPGTYKPGLVAPRGRRLARVAWIRRPAVRQGARSPARLPHTTESCCTGCQTPPSHVQHARRAQRLTSKAAVAAYHPPPQKTTCRDRAVCEPGDLGQSGWFS